MGFKMKIMTFALWVVLFFITLIYSAGSSIMAQTSKDQGVIVGRGFINGNNFISNTISKKAYVTGVIDGFYAGQMINNDKAFYWLKKCTEGMTNTQITAIVDKYLKNHPEEWHDYMNILVYKSLVDVCPRNKK